MGKKFRTYDIQDWLINGNVQKLHEHWSHPLVVAYRKEQLKTPGLFKKSVNSWVGSVCNGSTFSFLMQRDTEFQQAHADIEQPAVWFNAFSNIYRSAWGLLDVAPQAVRLANAVDTLRMLIQGDQDIQDVEFSDSAMRTVWSKIADQTHDFYCRFQQRGALTAIAWMDNQEIWTSQRPRMANLVRHSAMHNPSDVLGAYLVWACDAGCPNTWSYKKGSVNNADRMQQLRLLAERVGLDTQSYDTHVHQCKTLHEGLGLRLEGQNILNYAQGTTMTAAPLVGAEDIGALFV